MAHRHHRPPLSRRCVSGHVLRAVTLPIAIVAAVAFLSSVPAMSRLGAIALFVAVAIALFVAVAVAIAIALAASRRRQLAAFAAAKLLAAKEVGRRRRSGSIRAVDALAQRRR